MDFVMGDWIVHDNGGLTHKKCDNRHDMHRHDGVHFCEEGLADVPILVCELVKITRELYNARRATGERGTRTY